MFFGLDCKYSEDLKSVNYIKNFKNCVTQRWQRNYNFVLCFHWVILQNDLDNRSS